MREYIVCCKTKEDLQSFYDDMETPGGNLHIPDREVELANRRPISRNTHYMLTEEEAAQVANDARVLAVELTMKEIGVEFQPSYTITSLTEAEKQEFANKPAYVQDSDRWSKSDNNNDGFRNWGLIRHINGQQFSNYGFDGQVNIGGNSNSEDVIVTASGKNVDVVIVDGCIDPDHPEFNENEDNSGNSRVNQFNWFSLTNAVTGGSNGTYVYTPYIDNNYPDNNGDGVPDRTDDNDHGCHVAGTACGNRRGWARDANIYNINPYPSAPSTIDGDLIIDYIREWHNTKASNPETGYKNPTITNHSYGTFLSFPKSDCLSVTYRGTTYSSPSVQQLTDLGVAFNSNANVSVPYRPTTKLADIYDAILDGIIFVGAAGNTSHKAVLDADIDYDNAITVDNITVNGNAFTWYYNRGSAPSALGEVLNVGAMSRYVDERKATFSATGSAVDVYAAGEAIISSVHDQGGGANDSRDSSYNVIKKQGTSMAAPQVCGLLACQLELWPRLSQTEVLAAFRSQKFNTQSENIGIFLEQDTTPNFPMGQAVNLQSYTVGAPNASVYTFSGDASGNNIDITATEGTILSFSVSASGHPFWIKTNTSAGQGSGVTSGLFTEGTNGLEQGTLTWNTRGVTPGTYYYVCEYHNVNMQGEINITADTSLTSLQGGKNYVLKSPITRKVTSSVGTTYVGASTTSVQTWPRLDNKIRAQVNFGDIDQDIFNQGYQDVDYDANIVVGNYGLASIGTVVAVQITQVSANDYQITFGLQNNHYFAQGAQYEFSIVIEGATPSTYNGVYRVYAATSNTLTSKDYVSESPGNYQGGGSSATAYSVDGSPTKQIYPRHPIWSRRPV
jgi:hypothetical protein